MYAETGLMFPYFQNFSPEVHHIEDFCCQSQKSNACMGSLVQTSTISEYDLGGEGDLFKAPQPIIEQPLVGLDPMTAAISMISCGEDAISTQELKVAVIESIQSDQFLSDVFYECKDILAKEATGTPLSEVLNFEIPVVRTDENPITEENLRPQGPLPKSVSSECLSSMDWIQSAQISNLTEMDFGAASGMRRAFSEGDIKDREGSLILSSYERLANGNLSVAHSPLGLGQPQTITDRITEDRREKLSRYRNKKTQRNFGRKIKYACRKALADSQPRIRGRFAKTEESEILRK